MRTIATVSLWPIDITRLLFSSFEILSQPLMQPIPIVACFGEFLSLFSSSAGDIHVQFGFKSGDWLGQSKTFHLFALINSLTELAGCFGSLSWCNMKHFPMNLVAFSWILVVLYPSKFIPLQSSYIKLSVKLRGPVPETAIHAHAMTPPPPCFTDEAVCLGSFVVPFFLPTFSFPSLRQRFIIVSSVHKQFQISSGSPFCFFANSNLAFLFLVLVRGLYLAV